MATGKDKFLLEKKMLKQLLILFCNFAIKFDAIKSYVFLFATDFIKTCVVIILKAIYE